MDGIRCISSQDRSLIATVVEVCRGGRVLSNVEWLNVLRVINQNHLPSRVAGDGNGFTLKIFDHPCGEKKSLTTLLRIDGHCIPEGPTAKELDERLRVVRSSLVDTPWNRKVLQLYGITS